MVKFSSKAIAVLLIVGVTFSCEQERELLPKKESVSELTTRILVSDQFNELNIDTNELDEAKAHFSDAEGLGIVIPFKGNEGKKFVMTLVNEKQQIRKVFVFEAVADILPEEFFESFESKKFEGSFKFADRSGSVQLTIRNSEIVSSSIEKNMLAKGAKPECGDLTSDYGALACAGARIKRMNKFDKTICYLTFPECFAQTVVSCIIDDCVINPDGPYVDPANIS